MSLSAHYKIPGGRRVRLLNARRNADGSITGTLVGHNNGFTSSPDRELTLTAAEVKRLRVRLLDL